MKLSTLNYIHNVLYENLQEKREAYNKFIENGIYASEEVRCAGYEKEKALKAFEEFEKNEW